MRPVAHIQTTGIYAHRNKEETAAIVSRNNIILVEDQRKLQQAIDQGNQKVMLTAALAGQMIARQKQWEIRAKRRLCCTICCFIIALILAIAFGVAFGIWKKNAENVQDSLFTLRDELQNDVFYADDYQDLKDICLSPDYSSSSCYDVGIRIELENPAYNEIIGVILSLPKNTQNNTLCLTSYQYTCSIRWVTYSTSSTDNCRASEFEINEKCQAVLTDSYDECTYLESLSVANGGSYYSAADVCSTGVVAPKLADGTVAACNDCNVVIRLENTINYADDLF